MIYDYYIDSLVPCLRRRGIEIPDPPEWETFLALYGTRHDWTPYQFVPPPDSADQWQAVTEDCPRRPAPVGDLRRDIGTITANRSSSWVARSGHMRAFITMSPEPQGEARPGAFVNAGQARRGTWCVSGRLRDARKASAVLSEATAATGTHRRAAAGAPAKRAGAGVSFGARLVDLFRYGANDERGTVEPLGGPAVVPPQAHSVLRPVVPRVWEPP